MVSAHAWGVTAEEMRSSFACDRLMPEFDDELYRAISIQAPAQAVVTYRIESVGPSECRLAVKLRVQWPRRRFVSRWISLLLPWGDLIMMKKQLFNLKALAERT